MWKLAATAAGNDEIHSIHVPLFSLPRESLEEEDDDGEEEEEKEERARRDPVRTVQAQALARSLARADEAAKHGGFVGVNGVVPVPSCTFF